MIRRDLCGDGKDNSFKKNLNILHLNCFIEQMDTIIFNRLEVGINVECRELRRAVPSLVTGGHNFRQIILDNCKI